jgi:anti-sigma regulatory factor (Ser/Thr protein kinase)
MTAVVDDSTDERSFDADPAAIGAARSFVTSRDGVGGDLADSLALVTSELASNAVLHARTPFVVRVGEAEGRVRVSVFDHSTRLPERRPHGPESVTGRGLAIIESIADVWGVEVVDGGKWVWAIVATDDGGALGQGARTRR